MDEKYRTIIDGRADAYINDNESFHVCNTCKWLEPVSSHICTCEETPAINVFGYEDTFGCNFWEAHAHS